jgi:serine/threonine-protein kinase
VYVTDDHNNRVVKLAAGSSTQTVLPFTGLNGPDSVAVDTAGSVYVADYLNNRVVKLAAWSSTQTVLPFTHLALPRGVAVDTAGSVYVTDFDSKRVVKLAADRAPRRCCRSPASPAPKVWPWAPPTVCTWSTAATTGW